MSFELFNIDLANASRILLLFLPIILIQFALMIFALLHLLKRKKTRNLNVIGWVLIIVLVNLIGPILYLLIGRSEDDESD